MKKSPSKIKTIILITLFSLNLCLISCGKNLDEQAQGITSQPLSTQSVATQTPLPPSPTPIPIVATVNGDVILLEEFHAELARYKAAVNRELTESDKELVLNDLIQQTLLAQAAYSEGFQIDETTLQERINDLGSDESPLEEWLPKYGYTIDSFREGLKRSLAAAWMRDKIISEVPETAEQVHAQQILHYTRDQANYTLTQLNNGIDFAQLAATYDPQTKGDLGWFPPGYLTMPELDSIVFNLEVGEYSEIIETDIGFHIIKVLEKESDRILPPDIRKIQQEKALTDWLERRWKLSTIEISLP
mgnify:CR=1 FL=1